MQSMLQGKSPRLFRLKSGSKKLLTFTGKHLQCSSFFFSNMIGPSATLKTKHSTVVALTNFTKNFQKNLSLEHLRVTISVAITWITPKRLLNHCSAWNCTEISKIDNKHLQVRKTHDTTIILLKTKFFLTQMNTISR